jgi:hypothetical protein
MLCLSFPAANSKAVGVTLNGERKRVQLQIKAYDAQRTNEQRCAGWQNCNLTVLFLLAFSADWIDSFFRGNLHAAFAFSHSVARRLTLLAPAALSRPLLCTVLSARASLALHAPSALSPPDPSYDPISRRSPLADTTSCERLPR